VGSSINQSEQHSFLALISQGRFGFKVGVPIKIYACAFHVIILIYIIFNFDEFAKSRIHQVFGVSCLVFGMKYMILYQHVRILNTKHQIQNTHVKRHLFGLFTILFYFKYLNLFY